MSTSAPTLKTPIPSTDTLTLTLDRLIQGNQLVIPNAQCVFSYKWNFVTNEGQASLDTINGTQIGIVLYPEGLSGELAFLSDSSPQSYVINGQTVIINRVILDIKLSNVKIQAAIQFGEDGSTTQATENWSDSSLI